MQFTDSPQPCTQTLQKYTREYLFEKFRAEVQPQAPPPPARPTQQPARLDNRLPPMRGSRPILAIETTSSHTNESGHVSMPRSGIVNGHGEQLPSQGLSAAALAELSPKMNTSSSKFHSSVVLARRPSSSFP